MDSESARQQPAQASRANCGPTQDLLDELNDLYNTLIPRDQVIGDHLAAVLQQRPDDFAPAS